MKGNNMAMVKNEIAIMKMLSKNKNKNVIQVVEVPRTPPLDLITTHVFQT